MIKLLQIIGNGRDLKLTNTDFYSVILGEAPSKGARSPKLWNAAFNNFSLSAVMHPMDVPFGKIGEVVEELRQDVRFIGGAVTMPYKSEIIPFLDRLEPEAETIGAVNCFYRQEDCLVGANTDGAGALASFQMAMGQNYNLVGKKILVFGVGGAGSAVATYFATAIGKTGELILVNRTKHRADELASKLTRYAKINVIKFSEISQHISIVDVIINCTVIGFEMVRQDEKGAYCLQPYTGFGQTENLVRVDYSVDAKYNFMVKAKKSIIDNYSQTLSLLEQVKKETVFFDIIYQPPQTMLLFLASCFGHMAINGLAMNLEQAVIAFDKTTVANKLRVSNLSATRQIMRQI